MKEGFGELYTRLYNENIQELETLRKKDKKQYMVTLTVIFILLICIFIMPTMLFAVLPTLFIVLFGVIIVAIIKEKEGKKNNNVKNYKQVYKEKIIAPLINNVFENGIYEPQKGLSRYEYELGDYLDDIDRYSSEDKITATVKGKDDIETIIKFAEVHTESRREDSDGDTYYSTQFYGLAGMMPLKKNISTRIYIRNNGRSFGGKNKVKMDMSEFERLFDVEARDKILAVRILTSDVMSEMIELYRKFKYRFEIHIINDVIYMRLSTGEMFEPSVFSNSLEYKTIEKYYLVLKAMMSISTHIYDTINDIEL